jgi:acetyl esterase/lipase
VSGQEKPPENVKRFTYKKTKQADLEMAVHFPPGWKEEDKRPAIVFFFGGGWENGTIRAFVPQAQYLASRGMVAARADYRVKSRHGVTPKECVEDARSAVRWLRQNAAKLGVDPDRIVASGGSAGGHIAACTTLMPASEPKGEDPKVSCKANALVLFNPVLHFGPQLLRRVDNDEAVGKAISPVLHLTKDSPPTLLFYGTEDWLLQQGEEFLGRSKELGQRTEMFTAPQQPHGFFHKSPWKEKTLQRADEFLVSLGYLRGKPTIRIPDAKGPQPSPRPPANLPPPTFGNVRYGPHERNVLDFWQAELKRPTPLLVSIHGGGFVAGNKSVGPQLLKECLAAGISVAAISYRYSTQAIAPAPFRDGARAVQFLRSKAKEWNLDPKRVAATGGSAGAGISLWLAFHDDLADPQSADPVLRQSTRLACVAAFNGQTSYDPRFIRRLFPDKDVYKIGALRQLFDVDLNKLDDLPAAKYRLFEEVSAINHLTRDDPPVLLSYSSPLDAEVTSMGIGIHHPRFGKVLKDKMDELKIPCELYAGGKRIGGGTPLKTIDFLKKHLGVTR